MLLFILEIIIPLILYALFLLSIWFIVRIVLKNKKRKLIEQYTLEIKKDIQYMSDHTDVFEAFYDKDVKYIVPSDFIGKELPLDITDFKTKYYDIVDALVNISKDNTVFFTSSKEWNVFENKYPDRAVQDEIISNDIIKTAPLLAQFASFYSIKKKNTGICSSLTRCNESLWAGLLYRNEKDDGSDDYKEKKKYLDYSIENCFGLLDDIIRDWRLSEEIPQKDMLARKIFTEVYDNYVKNEDLREEWIKIYFDGMQKVTNKRGYSAHFCQYINFDIEARKKYEQYEWYGHLSNYGSMGFDSSLRTFTDNTYDELMRIYNLYQTGQMKGHYYTCNDPKYSAKE